MLTNLLTNTIRISLSKNTTNKKLNSSEMLRIVKKIPKENQIKVKIKLSSKQYYIIYRQLLISEMVLKKLIEEVMCEGWLSNFALLNHAKGQKQFFYDEIRELMKQKHSFEKK